MNTPSRFSPARRHGLQALALLGLGDRKSVV